MDIDAKGLLALAAIFILGLVLMFFPVFCNTNTCAMCGKKTRPITSSELSGRGSTIKVCEDCCDTLIHYIHTRDREDKTNKQ